MQNAGNLDRLLHAALSIDRPDCWQSDHNVESVNFHALAAHGPRDGGEGVLPYAAQVIGNDLDQVFLRGAKQFLGSSKLLRVG